MELDPNLCMLLLVDLTHHEEVVRVGAAKGLADALEQFPDYLPAILSQLLEIYQDKLYVSRLTD